MSNLTREQQTLLSAIGDSRDRVTHMAHQQIIERGIRDELIVKAIEAAIPLGVITVAAGIVVQRRRCDKCGGDLRAAELGMCFGCQAK